MDWIRDVVLALLITSVTGGMLLLAWMAAVYISRKKMNIRYVYWMLRGVLAGYLLSHVYLIIHRCREHMRNEFDVLYASTAPLDKMFLIFFFIWVVGGLILIVSQIHMWVYFQKIKKSRMIVPKEYVMLLQKLCAEMKLRKSIRLYQGHGVQTPFICGIWKPEIYLPVREFTAEELEMILYHELAHYKQGDTFWKPVFGLVGNIYWFNPLSRILWREAVRWTEANCDACCCEERFDTKKYFTLLLAMGSAGRMQVNGYAPMWTEGGEELIWRINCMKKHFKKKTNVVFAAVIAVISILGGSVSAHAATQGIKMLYDKALSYTVEETEEPLQGNTLQEYAGTVDDFEGIDIVEHQEDEIEISTNWASGIMDWEVGNHSIHYSRGFPAKAGGDITVAAGIKPKDKSITVGIVKPDGKIVYVTGKDILHDFNVSKTGTYKIFILNTSGKEVAVIGFYMAG